MAYCRQGDKHGGHGYASNYWGMHQLHDYRGRITLLESVKTAVFCWCHYGGGCWLATQSFWQLRLPQGAPDRLAKFRKIWDYGENVVRVAPDGNAVFDWTNNERIEHSCWGKFSEQFGGTMVQLWGKCRPEVLGRLGLDSGSDVQDVILKQKYTL